MCVWLALPSVFYKAATPPPPPCWGGGGEEGAEQPDVDCLLEQYLLGSCGPVNHCGLLPLGSHTLVRVTVSLEHVIHFDDVTTGDSE